MHPDLKDLLSVLNARNVKYLVVGGYAVSFHAQPRATKDIDLFVGTAAGNAEALFHALAEFGAPLSGISAKDFTNPELFFRFGREPMAFDILPSIDGVNFETAWERRIEGVIDAETGLRANFIGREDLIAAKLAAGRTRDLADVEDLREPGGAR